MFKKIALVLGLFFLFASIVSAAKHAPDLVVKDIKVHSSTLEASQTVKIVYTIKNEGIHPSDPSVTSIKILSKDGKDTGQSMKKEIPALAPGAFYTTEVKYSIKQKGNYMIQAIADYNDKIREANETNNYNTLKFSVGIKLK